MPASSAEQLGAELLGLVPLNQRDMSRESDYASAVIELKGLLGAEYVLCDDAIRAEFSKTTLPRKTIPSGVVRPSKLDEVVGVVGIAHRCNIPVHTISRGKNWGYGDACAPTDGQMIIDMRRMDCIREVNTELGYAVIEPGVSQGQMYEHLRENRIPLLLDVTGAGPDSSIIGNVLQRGFGHTPYGDRYSHTRSFEVVLSDGRLISTGAGPLSEGGANAIYSGCVGPEIKGLFTQSSLGVVTAGCIDLQPYPNSIEAFAMRLRDDESLGRVIDTLRSLRRRGIVNSAVHIANDLRVLSGRIAYPWDRCGGKTPMPPPVRTSLRREHSIGAWNVFGGLYSWGPGLGSVRSEVSRSLGKVGKVRFVNRRRIDFAKSTGRLLARCGRRKLSDLADTVDAGFNLLEGIPNSAHLQGVAWRSRQEGPVRDVRDHGLIWKSPQLPARSADALRLLSHLESAFQASGFDLLVTLTLKDPSTLECVTSINFDKSSRRDVQLAEALSVEVDEIVDRLGYGYYRRGSI